MTDELPPGWALVTVGDIAHFVRGVTYSKEHARDSAATGFVPVLRATNIGDGLDFNDMVFVPDRFVSDEQIVKDGDVVLAMSSGSKSVVGKAAIAKSPPRCGFGAFCGVIRPSDAIDHSLLGYYFQTKAYRNAISDVSKGSNINNLKAEHVLCRPLPIPPKTEQARIVSKLDELFSRIDEGERALERVATLVERYRQSVLKAAVTGELTRDWREKNKDQLESGEALLARILKARREAWEKAELDKMKAKGITPANDKWKQKYEEPAAPDTSGLPELPVGWMWLSLDAVADIVGGITVDQKRDGDDLELVPYLRVANVQRGYLDLSEIKSIRAPRDRIEALSLRSGDILFNEGGDLDKLGRGWIWEAQLPLCIHQNHVFRARLFIDVGLNKIISWYCNVLGRTLFMSMGKQTTNLASLSLSKLKSLPVPMMSRAEATEIVSMTEDVLSVVDKQREELERQSKGSSALRQSVLRSAFSGLLVSQEEADEPASVLLERIAAERHATPTNPKRGRTKRTVAGP